MFNRDEKLQLKDAETIIGPSVKVKGEFNGQGDIIVEGVLEGSLKTGTSLRVGDKAKIKANVEAKDSSISGEVIGNIKIKGALEITATAKITGDIETSSISIEKGAQINGRISMGGAAPIENKTEVKLA
ncbi:MAG: polymer-forming cytoskeletal protein [Patescibacteria group bacterium]